MNGRLQFDLVIVGGGPAGVAAANGLAGRGLHIAVIDEQQRPGGQILRQPPTSFRVSNWLENRIYRPLKSAISVFETSEEIEWYGGRSVVGIERTQDGFHVIAASQAGVEDFHTEKVLLATGCYDLPVPRPGWTLPGAMAAGGIQTLLKAQQLLPDEPLILAGTHPLMLLIADQIVTAGGKVAVIAFEQSLPALIRPAARAPFVLIQNLPLLVGVMASFLRLRRHGVPIYFDTALTEIDGVNHVTAANFRRSDGRTLSTGCAAIGLCYGFVPQSDLSRLAGAEVSWASPAGGWAARHDEGMRSSVSGLYVAGETAGVGGAATALAEGQLAAISILRDMGHIEEHEAQALARPAIKRRHRHRAFADRLAAIGDPSAALARPVPPETTLCRCEDIPIDDADVAMRRTSCANTIKLETRIGMGLCQGRSCEHALLRHIAGGGVPIGSGFTPRFPVRPVRIGDLAKRRTITPGLLRQATEKPTKLL